MVTRSIDNYERHKKDVYEYINLRYGAKKAQKFLDFYSDRYDKFNRSFISYKLAFQLLDDYYYVKRKGTRWYACVGVGGTGKTTLMKNVSYYFDKTFDLSRVNLTILGFIKKLKDFKKVNAMRTCFLDEPDDSFHTASKEGKVLREILGKMRQQQVFLGICATDLKDIPPYIYRKLNGIFFLPFLGKGMFFKDKPRKGVYVLQQIRDNYSKMGYKIFYQLSKSQGCLNFDTIAGNPLTTDEEKAYLKVKRDDYAESIEHGIRLLRAKKPEARLTEREEILIRLRKKGWSHSQISEVFDVSRRRIGQLLGNLEGWNENIL